MRNLCFSFLVGFTAFPREIKNNTYAKFSSGENKEYYGVFEKGLLYPAVEAFQETTRAASMISQKPKPFKVRVSEVVPVQIVKI